GGRFVNAALDVGTGIDAHDMTAGRDGVVRHFREVGGKRIGNEGPWVIQRRVLGVELLALVLHVVKAVGGGTAAIKNGEPVAHQLAVIDERTLNRWANPSRAGDDAYLFLVA